MEKSSISLGLCNSLKAEAIAELCRKELSRVDDSIARDFAAWFAKTLNVCRNSRHAELRSIAACLDANDDVQAAKHALVVLWHVYYMSHFRTNLVDAYGQEKTDATYTWARDNLTTRARRSALYANMFKLSTFADFKNHLRELDVRGHVTLVKLVDAITNTKDLVEGNPLHLPQLESTVACNQASLKDKIISSILPDANSGVKGLLEKTLKMVKDSVNPAGKKDQTTDELCLELCASPLSILMMTAAACISGSTGLIVIMVPLFAAWSAGNAISGMLKEAKEGSNLHNFLENTTKTLLTKEFRPDLEKQVEKTPGTPLGTQYEDKATPTALDQVAVNARSLHTQSTTVS